MKKYSVVTLFFLSIVVLIYSLKIYFIDGLPNRHTHIKQFSNACFKQYEPFKGLSYNLTTSFVPIKGVYKVNVSFSDEPNRIYEFEYYGDFKKRNGLTYADNADYKKANAFHEPCELKK